jgi:hypothetical protein
VVEMGRPASDVPSATSEPLTHELGHEQVVWYDIVPEGASMTDSPSSS